MKITKIELKGYNQFKDVEIDLTYPNGHKKEGKPLDKVCFIGRSGTGKTSLLRLIKWFVSMKRDIGKNFELPLPPGNTVRMDFQRSDLDYTMYNTESHPFIDIKDKKTNKDIPPQLLIDYYEEVKPVLINFPTEILTGDKPPGTRPTEPLDILGKIKVKDALPYKLKKQEVVDFAIEDVRQTWDYILRDIKEHQEQELLFKEKIADAELKKYATLEKKLKGLKKKTDAYRKWSKQNPNPLKVLAKKYLDPILFDLGLKTKMDIDLETISHLGFINLQTLTGQYVPWEFWSTGTRQLIQTVIPLYQLKPKNAIILLDEPERSLYPDIQSSIIGTYAKLAPECQFFFATHSALIASSFEPWEIVDLKFDDKRNYVFRELDYEGQNHVDNYKFHPEYLRWDSILARIFDLEEEGGKKRLRALERLADIKIRINKLKQEDKLESPGGKKLVDEYLALSDKLDWRIQIQK